MIWVKAPLSGAKWQVHHEVAPLLAYIVAEAERRGYLFDYGPEIRMMIGVMQTALSPGHAHPVTTAGGWQWTLMPVDIPKANVDLSHPESYSMK